MLPLAIVEVIGLPGCGKSTFLGQMSDEFIVLEPREKIRGVLEDDLGKKRERIKKVISNKFSDKSLANKPSPVFLDGGLLQNAIITSISQGTWVFLNRFLENYQRIVFLIKCVEKERKKRFYDEWRDISSLEGKWINKYMEAIEIVKKKCSIITYWNYFT